jgi:hypothetical protein
MVKILFNKLRIAWNLIKFTIRVFQYDDDRAKQYIIRVRWKLIESKDNSEQNYNKYIDDFLEYVDEIEEKRFGSN